MRSVELFSGCGGLAFGLAEAGFEHELLVEWDDDAVATVIHNRERRVRHISKWPIRKDDVREVNWRAHEGASLVAGGPPCQPFSIAGKHKGIHDHRDMWPQAIKAVREVGPAAFLFENVRNLAGPRFGSYLDWIKEHLQFPSYAQRIGEDYLQHTDRLRKSDRPKEYEVIAQVVNAADFGAPQIRYRVLIFGVRPDVGFLRELKATHSRDRLLWDQFVTGQYWRRHGLAVRDLPDSARDAARVAKLRTTGIVPEGLPWVTVRDALAGLGNPDGKRNHTFQKGAKVYKGHTGSVLDFPSKALKAGDHGVPGGENMMVQDDGTVRYFTLREAARLVGLPDEFEFPASWTESMRQLGNAVPTALSKAAGNFVRSHLSGPEIEEKAVA